MDVTRSIDLHQRRILEVPRVGEGGSKGSGVLEVRFEGWCCSNV